MPAKKKPAQPCAKQQTTLPATVPPCPVGKRVFTDEENKKFARMLVQRSSLRVQAAGHKFARGSENVLADVRRENNLAGELPEVLAEFEKIFNLACEARGQSHYFDFPAKKGPPNGSA